MITYNHRHIAYMNFTVAAFFATLSLLYLPTCHSGNNNNNGFIYGARLTNAPMRSQQSATVAIPKDTTKKKGNHFPDTTKKVFVPAVKIRLESFYKALDSIGIYAGKFGRSKTGEEIDYWNQFLSRQLNNTLFIGATQDSIEIVNPKK